jgi:hypothetical protein
VVSLKKLNLKSVFIVTLQLQESDAATVLNRPSSFGSQQTCTKNNLFKQKTAKHNKLVQNRFIVQDSPTYRDIPGSWS